jgi:hypothetical protein
LIHQRVGDVGCTADVLTSPPATRPFRAIRLESKNKRKECRMSKPFNLPALRGKLALDQAQMAERMGLDAPDYVELETSPEKVQRRHAMLAHLVSLDVAIERGQPNLATPPCGKRFSPGIDCRRRRRRAGNQNPAYPLRRDLNPARPPALHEWSRGDPCARPVPYCGSL